MEGRGGLERGGKYYRQNVKTAHLDHGPGIDGHEDLDVIDPGLAAVSEHVLAGVG